jgi:hypothetical protein
MVVTPPLIAVTLVRADHIRSFHLEPAAPGGWQAFEWEDDRLVQHYHTDWHLVELTRLRFAREVAKLKEQGWSET